MIKLPPGTSDPAMPVPRPVISAEAWLTVSQLRASDTLGPRTCRRLATCRFSSPCPVSPWGFYGERGARKRDTTCFLRRFPWQRELWILSLPGVARVPPPPASAADVPCDLGNSCSSPGLQRLATLVCTACPLPSCRARLKCHLLRVDLPDHPAPARFYHILPRRIPLALRPQTEVLLFICLLSITLTRI